MVLFNTTAEDLGQVHIPAGLILKLVQAFLTYLLQLHGTE